MTCYFSLAIYEQNMQENMNVKLKKSIIPHFPYEDQLHQHTA